MKSVEILLYLQRNNITVFTTGDLAKIIRKPIGYAQSTANRIPGVKRAERGLYYTEQASIYEVASNVVPFSYVSMLSALRYYDLTTQIPSTVSVVSPKKHRKVKLEGYKVEFIRFRERLIFGYVRRGNAFIAEPEKAMLDAMHYGSYAYLDEAFEYGTRDKLVDVDKLIRYAHRFGEKTLMNKLGFFLDLYAGISRDDLQGGMSKKPLYLLAKARNYSKKWRVYYG